MRAAVAAAIVAAALSLLSSAFGSSFPGGRWYTTGFAWAFGLAAVVLIAVVLKGRAASRAAKAVAAATVAALLVLGIVAGNTDALLRRRVESASGELVDFCTRSVAESGVAPGPGELLWIGRSSGPVSTYDIGGFEFGAPYVFRAPSGGIGCLVEVHSLGFGFPTKFGLVFSPGGAPAIGRQWDSFTHLTGDWWVWKREGAPPGAPM